MHEIRWSPDEPGSELAVLYRNSLGALVAVVHGTYGWRLRWYPANPTPVCRYIDLEDGHATMEELIKLDDHGKLRLAKRLACAAIGVMEPLTPAEEAEQASIRG